MSSMMYLHLNRCVLLKLNNRQAWDTLYKLMDHNEERFAKDQDTIKMYSLITNFFLSELKLDFVSKVNTASDWLTQYYTCF